MVSTHCSLVSAPVCCLRLFGLKGQRKIKKRVEIRMSEEQRLSMFRNIAAESERLLWRRAALSHEEQYYTL